MTNKNSIKSNQLTHLDRADLDRGEEVYEAELVEEHDRIEPAPATSLARNLGRIAGAVARGGERSYRDLLVEAGAIGQRIYLAAEAAGLAARNLAAFRDDRLNGLLGLDGRREAVIHLTMFGPGD